MLTVFSCINLLHGQKERPKVIKIIGSLNEKASEKKTLLQNKEAWTKVPGVPDAGFLMYLRQRRLKDGRSIGELIALLVEEVLTPVEGPNEPGDGSVPNT